jgi:hypothetical protein
MFFLKHKKVDLIFSNFYFINKQSRIIQEVRLRPFNKKEYLYVSANISNQSAFWTRGLFLKTRGLNIKYHYGLDFDFFVRASERGKFKYVNEFLGCSRIHEDSKTVTTIQDEKWRSEYALIRKKYGINMSLEIPWNHQYRLHKYYFKMRRLFYYLATKNFGYLIKKMQRNPLVQQWKKDEL